MKTIGLIGGMSWESTVEYYRLINEEVKNRLGGFHSAKCVLYSVDFAEIETYQHTGEWDRAAQVLGEAAQNVERAGADFVLLCTNTMHKVFETMQNHIQIPIIHIADATAARINAKGYQTVGLLGTRYTMEQDFYKARLEQAGISVVIPDADDREKINAVIFEELCFGVVSPESRKEYLRIIRELQNKNAQGIVLGCTEIGLLVKPNDVNIPLFDTTAIHAHQAVELALG